MLCVRRSFVLSPHLRVRLFCSPAPDRERRLRPREAMAEMLKTRPKETLRMVIDCDSITPYYQMNEKETKDLVKQIVSCYGVAIRALSPCLLHLVGVTEGGAVEKTLVDHFHGYTSPNVLMEKSSRPLCEEFDRREMVYLSPYSPCALGEVSSRKVYVMGGVVDRQAKARLTERAARGLRIPTARLPIREYMQPGENPHHLNLTLDIVVKLLVSVHHDGCWKKALSEHFPKRKGWEIKDS